VSRWNAANALTAGRLALAPAMALTLLCEETRWALVVFVLAIASDLADGHVARRRREATAFGGFFDHATDAVFVASGLGALAHLGVVPVWLAPLLLAAFVQYTLDSRVVAGRPLRASRLGRWNGIAYFVVLGTPVIRDAIGWSTPPDPWVRALGWLLVASTVVSMLDRLVASAAARSDGVGPA
jgi:phosphatidylglycerophosphate synthase